MRGTVQKLALLDETWNSRTWDRYAALIDDDLEAWVAGEDRSHGKSAHLDRAATFCEAFPDAKRQIASDFDLFASPDGLNSLSVLRVTGTAVAVFPLPAAASAIPARLTFDSPLMLACRWHSGRIVRLREQLDHLLMARQLGRRLTTTTRNPDRA